MERDRFEARPRAGTSEPLTSSNAAHAQNTRRSFLDGLLALVLAGPFAAFAYAVLRYINPPLTREAVPNEIEAARTDDPELAQSGFKIVRYGPDPVIVIRLKEGEYRAFSATCTHLGCVVHLKAAADRVLECNCHGGTYDLSGKNVTGPPPRPLRPYRVRLAPSDRPGHDIVFVSRV